MEALAALLANPPIHQHPINNRNPPLRKLRQQLLDRNLLSRDHHSKQCFNRLKQFRRITTRDEKKADNYLAILTLASIITLAIVLKHALVQEALQRTRTNIQSLTTTLNAWKEVSKSTNSKDG
ncbi:hypothetical protein LC613_38020 [Nostoc sphaeroides CHAB 2801]|uniref:hypothetical protein n=1 Tax=Nostoc sphaeroides TaxID=446679 RepID=UPI001E2959D3|nr:hypothetical protein [Nostoc sphaeroides]MCC5633283.1 hypothetical protein [Nostoc sphaeroides CHAB 2801]